MNNYLIRPIPLCKGKRNKTQLTYRKGEGRRLRSAAIWYLEGPVQDYYSYRRNLCGVV